MRSRITSSYEEHPEKRPGLLKFSEAFDSATCLHSQESGVRVSVLNALGFWGLGLGFRV